MADAPVLLITGVGMAATAELRSAPILAEHFRVLAFYAGRPVDPTPARDVVAALADEAVARLDADAAHVYGLSFGGMVAQEVALRHPDRVRSLVLGATSAGGDLRVPPEPAARDFIERRSAMPVEEGLWASVPYSYAQRTRRRHAERIGQDIARRTRAPVDRADHALQRDAVLAHDAADRLRDLAVPTLVVHGDEDRMVPAANGVLLRDAIPGARLLLLPEAAHLYPTDAPDADREVVRFFLDCSTIRRRPRASGTGRAAPA